MARFEPRFRLDAGLMKWMRRLFVLPVWLTLLIAAPSFALLIFVFLTGRDSDLIGYISYAASAYALAILCVQTPRIVRAVQAGFAGNRLIARIRALPQVRRYLEDSTFSAEVSLYSGLIINLMYAALKLASGIAFRSVWFGALAGYYLLLSALRFTLLNHVLHAPVGEDMLAEWKRYRVCGAVLLVMNQALAVVAALVVWRNSGFEYPGYLIYIMAMYTFYAVYSAVRSVLRTRRHTSPVMTAAKTVNLVAALVSLLSLETAMITQFGSADEPQFRQIMTGCTGAAVCTIVLVMAVYMICRATKQIRYLKEELPKV